MNKPLRLVVEETMDKIIKVLNDADITHYTMIDILAKLQIEIHNEEDKEIEKYNIYQEKLKKEEQGNDKENNKNS